MHSATDFCFTQKQFWLSLLTIFLVGGTIANSQSIDTPATEKTREIKLVEKYFPSAAIKILNIYGEQSTTFPSDYKIEIKNVSDKPIYFVDLVCTLPLARKYYGAPLSVKLIYGNPNLVTTGRLADPDDVPIKPGETAFLTPYKKMGQWLYEAMRDKGIFEEVSYQAILMPQFVNFGDGSGYQFHKYYQSPK